MKVKSMAKNTSKAEKKGALSIKNVTKIYDPTGVNVMAVDDCSMEIAGGEVCMIVGPSGCGKTTLLNGIAGFHSITEGSIHLDGELLCGPGKPKADQSAERMVVFQHGALFPWKTLQENVAYGPSVQKSFVANTSPGQSRADACGCRVGKLSKKIPW
jgi:NitT/TauT family transport system ATP-binding protein